MSDYTQLTDFSAKDDLPSGNAGKIIKGADFDGEFAAISTAIATKANTSALSSYLTTANAASTYLTIANAASTYLTIVNSKLIEAVAGYSSGTAPGKVVEVSTGFTLSTGLTANTVFLVYNSSASSITITQDTGLSLRLAGVGTTGNKVIPPYGLAHVWCRGTTEYIISGSGVY